MLLIFIQTSYAKSTYRVSENTFVLQNEENNNFSNHRKEEEATVYSKFKYYLFSFSVICEIRATEQLKNPHLYSNLDCMSSILPIQRLNKERK